MRVLVVEDDRETAEYICSSLKALGHVTKHAPDGKEGFLDALDNDYDVMVVDRMLPGLDGLSLVKSVRSAKVTTPILFLSALGGLNDRLWRGGRPCRPRIPDCRSPILRSTSLGTLFPGRARTLPCSLASFGC